MLTIQEIAIKYRIKAYLIRKMANDPLVVWPPQEGDNLCDPIYEQARYVALKDNFSAAFLVVLAELKLNNREDIYNSIEAARPGRVKTRHSKLQERLNHFKTIEYETLFKRPELINPAVTLGGVIDKEAISTDRLIVWMQEVITEANKAVGYYYIASRLISTFPRKEWFSANRLVARAINRLCSSKHSPMADWIRGEGNSRIFCCPKKFDL